MTDQFSTAGAVAPADRAHDGFARLNSTIASCPRFAGLGYEEPTPIQREAIPPLLASRQASRGLLNMRGSSVIG